MSFLQINVDRGRQAHDLLWETAARQGIDIAIVNEPNRKLIQSKPWFSDNNLDAGIILMKDTFKVTETGKRDGYVWIKVDGVYIFSCYISPNITIDRFENIIEELGSEIRAKGDKNIIVAGDFNDKSPECSAPFEDRRGAQLTEWAASLNLVIVNKGNKPTFERGQQKSFSDLTLVTENLMRSVRNWEVLEEETASLHKYIKFEIARSSLRGTRISRFRNGILDKERCGQ